MNTQLRDLMTAIVSLSEINMKAQSRYSGMLSNNSYLEVFAREFQTITVDPGRQTGKTLAMSLLAEPNDLIVVRSMTQKDSFIRDYLHGRFEPQVVTVSEVALKLKSFNRVWIDDAKHVDMGKIYQTMCGVCKQFILLG